MQVYEFTLEVQDGSNNYVLREFVLAEDDRAAARFAREFADRYRPNAIHDHEHDIYSDPAGWPQWMLGHCARLDVLNVSLASTHATVRMKLVPFKRSFVDGLQVAQRLLGTVEGPSWTARALKRLVCSRFNLKEGEIENALDAVSYLGRWLASSSSAQLNENQEVKT